MTYEEAIEYAKETCYCAGCPIDMSSIGDEDPCSSCKHREFFEVVIEALGKQISKKPNIWHPTPVPPYFETDDVWGYKCPCCGNEYISEDDHHCKCGQALDWSEEEEEQAWVTHKPFLF